MKAVVQRVKSSAVVIDGKTVAAIGQGLNVLLGVVKGDTQQHAETLAAKIARLRIFEDAAGKMNRSILDIHGQCLVISQFTLCADIKKGNRPSFTDAAPPEDARQLYQLFCEALRQSGVPDVQTGVFAADMQVEILNDGPVTILMDTDVWVKGNGNEGNPLP